MAPAVAILAQTILAQAFLIKRLPLWLKPHQSDFASPTSPAMVTVVNVSEYFEAAQVGRGLGSLYHVDSLTLRLLPALDEEGHRPLCPITMQPITKNAALIQDGGVYQYGAIKGWFERGDTSPLTGLQLPRLSRLKLSSMTDVVDCFLDTCRERRDTARRQRVGEYAEIRRTLVSHGRCELAAWEKHLLDLEDLAVRLRRDLGVRSRMENRAIASIYLARIYQKSCSSQRYSVHPNSRARIRCEGAVVSCTSSG